MQIWKRAFVLSLVSLGLSLTTAHAGSSNAGLDLDFNAIIGGSDVSAGDPVASNTVLLVGKDGESTFVCSGSIIDNDLVLTAAHCLGQDGLSKLVVIFRTTVMGQGPVVAVADRRRPADFDMRARSGTTDWNDLAVVKLASKIPPGYSVSKILPSALSLRTGSTVTLAGYGINTPTHISGSTDNSGAGVLRKVDQSVLNANFSKTEFLVSLQNHHGACHGDSGGPAFVRQGSDYYLIGVASRMTDNDRVASNGDVNDFSCSVEMVYTNVLAQSSWIRNAMTELHR